jgi:mycothiol synthase
MTIPHDIETFLADIEDQERQPAISEAKFARLDSPESIVVVREEDTVLGLGVVASHEQNDGSHHWSVETAVSRSMQFATFEAAVVTAAMDLVPRRSALSVWSSRTTLDSALEDLGLVVVRSLAYMVVPLPLGKPVSTQPPTATQDHASVDVRRFLDADTDAFLTANADAFAEHREAGSLTQDDFAELKASPWFDENGILVAEYEERIVGFCWTKVHPDGDGEIYRIGVVGDHQGHGTGRRLLNDGFRHLSEQPSVNRGTLWVDQSNSGAMDLYTSVGMGIERVTSEYEYRKGSG